MSENVESGSDIYLRQLWDAMEAAGLSLSDARKIDHQRRKDVVGAIARFAIPKFRVKRPLDDRLASMNKHLHNAGGLWFWGLAVVGAILHYFLRDENRTYDFTWGSLLMLGAFGYVTVHIWETYRAEQRAKENAGVIDELRFRWMANGGDESRFYELQGMVVSKWDEFDTDSEEYRVWVSEAIADAFQSTLGNYQDWKRPLPPGRW
jgi:hypothetical protein